jgi:sec-independent protein translocase protein TatA
MSEETDRPVTAPPAQLQQAVPPASTQTQATPVQPQAAPVDPQGPSGNA